MDPCLYSKAVFNLEQLGATVVSDRRVRKKGGLKRVTREPPFALSRWTPVVKVERMSITVGQDG
jgi:hypothetical protein